MKEGIKGLLAIASAFWAGFAPAIYVQFHRTEWVSVRGWWYAFAVAVLSMCVTVALHRSKKWVADPLLCTGIWMTVALMGLVVFVLPDAARSPAGETRSIAEFAAFLLLYAWVFALFYLGFTVGPDEPKK